MTTDNTIKDNSELFADMTKMNEGFVERWRPMTEGMDDGIVLLASVAFENQANYMRRNKDLAPFIKYVFPLIRKCIESMVSPHVTVPQPMVGPVSAAFYMSRSTPSHTGGDESTSIPEVKLALESVTVRALSRKHIFTYVECRKPGCCVASINWEEGALNLAASIDRLVLGSIMEAAPKHSASASSLINTLVTGSNKVFRNNQCGAADWIAVGPEIGLKIEAHSDFEGKEGSCAFMTPGPCVVGRLSDRWTVICDPQFPTNKILMGYKGYSIADTGVIWAPYTFYTILDHEYRAGATKVMAAHRQEVRVVRPGHFLNLTLA